MASNFNVRQPADVALLAGVLAALRPFDPVKAIPAALGTVPGGPYPYLATPRSPPLPAWLWVDTGGQVIVAIDGILTAEEGLGLFASTLQPLTPWSSYLVNANVLSAARAVFGQLGQLFTPGPRQWLLIGHSYGGSLAQELAALLMDAGIAASVQVLTFGSPRPGDKALSLKLAGVTMRRYMNDDDPVPRFPPHGNEAPAAYLAAGYLFALTWSLYAQPQGGVVLAPDGSLSYASVPPGLFPITDVQLLGWALSDKGFFATGHALKEYRRRISLMVSTAPDGPSGQLIGSGVEQLVALTLSAFQAAAAGVAAFQSSPSGGSVMAQGYIPVAYRAKAIKVGLGYDIIWMGRVVMTSAFRSNARSLARALNAYLRRMQGAGTANHTEFNAALAAYWLVCVSSSLGFNPPLIVT